MLALMLIAQAPLCGGLYGLTPEQAPYTGCYVPGWPGSTGGAQIRVDPLSPSGYRATPVLEPELPGPAPVQPPPFQINR